jgi:hypothetical protein
MKKIFINIRYFLAPILILVSMVGVIIGGPLVWTGVVLFGVGILLDTLSMPLHTKGAGFDENGETNGVAYISICKWCSN